ncbi:hypothetical protein MGYG_02427 [Nannizzia gypsea CBS 118893]|uniref:Uncharacterized protein n=1 Tax=Arthroderma gypseum (strain ATCC MYA-4604 / CBS 118893) TaxID=535722 RepID=E4URJ4_ARTGP|nr:hypothetical protein MGYG_02427 [Nannizzia gypsea CBS 118893]EFQ99416.1 hypothetical protein MGYG_02427 [Nannizzia gypsea CBS 118893]
MVDSFNLLATFLTLLVVPLVDAQSITKQRLQRHAGGTAASSKKSSCILNPRLVNLPSQRHKYRLEQQSTHDYRVDRHPSRGLIQKPLARAPLNVRLNNASTSAAIGGFYQNGSVTEENLLWILTNVLLVVEDGHPWSIWRRDPNNQ